MSTPGEYHFGAGRAEVHSTYSRHQERKEKGVIAPSNTVVHPLTMVITPINTVVALPEVA